MLKKIFMLYITIIATVSLSASNLRIESNQLVKNIDKYKIIDVSEKNKFKLGHIKGALNFPINLTYEHKSINGKIVEPTKMQKLIRSLGLNIDDKIVIYDDETFFDSSRLFWTLEVYGFKDVLLLNSSYSQWKKDKLPISTKIIIPKKSNYVATINNKRLATKFTTQIATRNPMQTIIDARDYRSYIGEKSSAKRYGHIPKAIHIPATHNISSNNQITRLKDLKDLKKVYKNVKKDKKIVIYCAIGRIASTNYFALRELGYNVANYDASWKEWGNDFNLPIINLSNKK